MKDFKSIINKIESIILGLCVLGVLFLVIQIGFIKDMDMAVFYEDYNYVTDKETNKDKEVGYVILKSSSNETSKITVTINGKNKYRFNKENEVTLKVFDGDLIEIHSTLENDNFKIKVVGVSKNIIKPKLNEELSAENSIKTFFQVRIE